MRNQIFGRYNKLNDLLIEMYKFNKQDVKMLFEKIKKYVRINMIFLEKKNHLVIGINHVNLIMNIYIIIQI